jgi:hypothetical protein
MNILGGVLLYLGSLTMILAAAAIAAGTFLIDPEGGSGAPAAKAAAAPPPMARSKDANPQQKPKDGVLDVAKLHPVAPSASAITVRPSAERPSHVRPKRNVAKGTIRVRPTPQQRAPAYADPAATMSYGYAGPQRQPPPPPFFYYRR